MTYRLRILAAIVALTTTTGCGDADIRNRAPDYIEAGDHSANNVLIDYGHTVETYGPMLFSLGVFNPATGVDEFTGGVGSTPQPAGPDVVYIFKTLDPRRKAAFSDVGIEIETNVAYVLSKGGPVTIDAFDQAVALGPIDPALNDSEIAALFMNSDDRAPRSQSEKEPQITVTEADFSAADKETIQIFRTRLKTAQEILDGLPPDSSEYERARFELFEIEAILEVNIANAEERAREEIRARGLENER